MLVAVVLACVLKLSDPIFSRVGLFGATATVVCGDTETTRTFCDWTVRSTWHTFPYKVYPVVEIDVLVIYLFEALPFTKLHCA